MGEGKKLKDELIDLQSQLFALSSIKDEVWTYHPSNPDFVNPIKLYEELKTNMVDIERRIKELEWRLNSLN
jgi:hypothetical protein